MARSMTNRELVTLLNQQEKSSLGGAEYDLQDDRQEALDYFHGKETGKLSAPQDPTRSSFVSRDTMETVLWVMPSLLRVFASGRPVEFEPVGPEDEQLARQETDLVNHSFMKESGGFLVLYQWFWDALVQKNGYVHYYWGKKSRTEIQSYSGLQEDEVLMLMQQLDYPEIVEAEVDEAGLYELKVRCEKEEGVLEVDNLAPEDVRVSTTATLRLKDASYVSFRSYPTRTSLIEDGFDKQTVNALPAHKSATDNEDELHRATVLDETNQNEYVDKASERVEVWTAYVRVDWDDDGRAELRRVVYSGVDILENEEYDTIPIANLTPFVLPHKHVGMSIHDMVKDLQEIRTVISRQMLDNIYSTAHDESVVSQDKIVDINEWTMATPGGIRRVYGSVNDAVMPLQNQAISHRLLPILDYFDLRKETRTGVGKATQGLDADVLKETTQGAYERALKRSGEMIESIARVFAETGIKDLFLGMHEMLVKHQDKEKVVRMRNEWIPMNPLEWKYRDNVTINVGLGTDTGDEEVQKLMMLGQVQEKAFMAGVVSPQNIYNLCEDIVAKSGIEKNERYFTPPQKMPPKQQQPNPLVEAEMVKQQGRQQAEQMKYKFQAAMKQAETQEDRAKMLADLILKDDHFRKSLGFDIMELEVNAGVDVLNAGVGAELKQEELRERSRASGGRPVNSGF